MKHALALLAGLLVILGMGLAVIPAPAGHEPAPFAPVSLEEPQPGTSPSGSLSLEQELGSPFGPEDYVMIRADEVSSAMWDDLLAAGHRGHPGDGVEALYPSSGQARAVCRTDRDCWIASHNFVRS